MAWPCRYPRWFYLFFIFLMMLSGWDKSAIKGTNLLASTWPTGLSVAYGRGPTDLNIFVCSLTSPNPPILRNWASTVFVVDDTSPSPVVSIRSTNWSCWSSSTATGMVGNSRHWVAKVLDIWNKFCQNRENELVKLGKLDQIMRAKNGTKIELSKNKNIRKRSIGKWFII